MRGFEEVIREAELLASSPEAVAAYLRERAERLSPNGILDEGDKQMEKSLLARTHPLIDLALARYCRHSETAHELFFREPANAAVRLAVLSNIVVCEAWFGSFPRDLFNRDDDKVSAYLAKAIDEELCALFKNPKLDDSFLRGFLDGGPCWQGMSEDKRLVALYALCGNKRMWTPYDDDFMDFDAQYIHSAVFNAAWKLAETSPTTFRWANVLNSLYGRLQPDAFSIENPLQVAARWQPQDDETIKRESESVGTGFLSDYEGVRKGLAKLALAKSRTLAKTLLDSEDVAFRAAVYAHSDLSVAQIGESYSKDGVLAYQAMIDNESLWRQGEKRDALHDIALEILGNDQHSPVYSDLALNIFNGRCKKFASDHPEWFKDDEDSFGDDEDSTPLVLDGAVAGVEIAQIKDMLNAINSRVSFVWWFSLGALIIAASRHF